MKCINCGVETPDSQQFCNFCGVELKSNTARIESKYSPTVMTTILCFIPLALLLLNLLLLPLFGSNSANTVNILFNLAISIGIVILWVSLIGEYKNYSYHFVRVAFVILFSILRIIATTTNIVFLLIIITYGLGYFASHQITTISLVMQILNILAYLFLIVPLTMIYFLKPRVKSFIILWVFQLIVPIVFIVQKIVQFLIQDSFIGLQQFSEFMVWVGYTPILIFAIVGFIRLKESKV